MAALTKTEAAVYDRQLRVWGLETQQKLRNSKVMIVGCTGLSAEVAKNIVLAGVGSVTLVDDAPCSGRDPGNFLIPHDIDPSQTVAEASVATLQEMNPLVTVGAVPGSPSTYVTEASVAGYNLVLLVGQPGHVVSHADSACTKAGVPFLAACCRGFSGWAFANLHSHDYIVETKKEADDGSVQKTIHSHHIDGVVWDAMLAAARPKLKLRRMSPIINVLRVCGRFEIEQQREARPSDIPVLQNALQELCSTEGLVGGTADGLRLAGYVEQKEEMPAINAVLGGVVANDVIKVVASKGEPLINNLFMYSLLDGAGWVERIQ